MDQLIVNQRYRIDKRIGEGGMAVVYRGYDLVLNRPVAIKTLHPQLAADPTIRARFIHEAQAVAGFSHPHIVEVYDVGEERGAPYIVMEYVPGESLNEIIASEGPFAPDDVAALLDQVGSALDYAHERGLVHRDIKPQNILVTRSGQAKVVDFGIAKGLTDTTLTAAGASLGTVQYASPEQISGLIATPVSDVYSLAVIAFEMLTKRLPFNADTPVGIAMQHVRVAPPRPSTLNPEVPTAVDAIVLRGLAKDPAQRYQSAGQFAAAMTNWEGDAARAPTATLPSPLPQQPTGPNSPEPQPQQVWSPPKWEPVSSGKRPPNGPGWPVVAGAAAFLAVVALIWVAVRHTSWIYDSGSNKSPTATVVAAIVPTATANALAAAPTAVPSPAATTPGGVAIPNVVGKSLADATALLNGSGFQLQNVGSMYSESIPAGAIAVQDPESGQTAPLGSTVYVKQSLGSATIDLAGLDLIGQDPAAATKLLQSKGLNVQEDTIKSGSVPAGKVAGIDPPRSATVGQTVTLHISAGPNG